MAGDGALLLADRDILREIQALRLVIDPLDEAAIQPASIDLRLDGRFLVFRHTRQACIDVRQPARDIMEEVVVDEDEPFFLQPASFVLACTIERLVLPSDLVGRVDGRSSLGRLGLLVHATAGYVDPGFQGQLTLELSNQAPLPIALYRGMRICQVSFHRLSSPALRPYGSPGLGSKYQQQRGPTASLVHLDR